MVYGIDTGYNQNYNYQMKPKQGLQPNSSFYNSTGIFPVQQSVTPTRDDVADGKDDGSIGFFSAAKNFVKGVAKFVVSPFTDENGTFSLGKTLKSAAIAGLFVVGNIATGGALTPILLTVGGAAGAFGMAKAGYNIATAETDAEAEAAWQSMGSSTATVAATVAGARSYAKSTAIEHGQTAEQAAESYKGVKGTLKAVKDTAVDAGHNAKAGYKFTKGKLADGYNAVKTSYKKGTLKSDAKEAYNTVKDTASEYYKAGKETIKNLKEARKEYAKLTPEEKAAQRAELKAEVKKFAEEYGLTKENAKELFGATWKDRAKTAGKIASNPFVIGTNTVLGRQTIRPDFYSQLTPEQQSVYDGLSDYQKEELIRAYQVAN